MAKAELVKIICLFLLAFTLRTILLGTVPTGISYDELDYVLNAKSFFLTGKGFINGPTPVAITPAYPRAELQSIVFSPLIGLTGLSLFTARLPHALLGSLFAVLMYFVAKRLLGAGPAFIIGIVTAVNPWNIFLTRTAYDATFTAFFLLLGFHVIQTTKKWAILLALLPLFLAYHGYMGMMVLFLPYVVLITAYGWFIVNRNKFLPQYLIVIGVCSLFVIRFFLYAATLPGNRVNELLLPWSPEIAKQVSDERRVSVVHPVMSVFANKLTVYVRVLADKYTGVFSPWILFLHGDTKYLFSLFKHGLFYVIDAVFMITGFGELYRKKKKELYILLALILIAPLPSAFSSNGETYASRAYLLLIPLIFLTGYGIYHVWSKGKTFLNITIAGMYLFFIGNFLTVYFLVNPINNPESFNFSTRIMSRYAQLESRSHDVLVLGDTPKSAFKQYLFYTNGLSRNTIHGLTAVFASTDLKIGTIRFAKCIPPETDIQHTVIIKEGDFSCKPDAQAIPPQEPFRIMRPNDAGTVFEIFNGNLCDAKTLNRYPSHIRFPDLSVEHLSKETFCRSYISMITD